MPRAVEPPRAWQRMLSGRRLDLLNPSPLDIEIEDIAHGLARVARWNGQTSGAHIFSVAQHTLLVDYVVVPNVILNATYYRYQAKSPLFTPAFSASEWANRLRLNMLVNF